MEKLNEGASLGPRRIRLTWLGMIALLILGGVLVLGQVLDADHTYWAITLIAASGVFAAVFVADRDHWWALIPAYALVMTGIYAILGGGTDPYDSWEAGYWALAVSVPFVVVFATSPKQRWWALAPAYFWLAGGLAVLLELDELWIPAYLTIATALPFFAAYAANRERTWLLITGGMLAALGIAYVAAAAELPVLAIVPVVGIFFLARMVSRQRERARAPEKPRYGPEADKPPAEFEALGSSPTRSGGDR
jgi:hypothetical protein